MADGSQNIGHTPPEAGAERPSQGSEAEKQNVMKKVRSSLDALKKQLPQGKELKEVIEKAPDIPRNLLEAVAEAQRLKIDLLADPEIRRLNQELVEKLSPGDDAILRQWLLGVPAELQALRSDVETGKGKPQDALSSLGSEGGAMARVDLLTQPGGLLSLENVKKFAGSIPFLAKKDAQGNVLPMSDEQALAIQGTVLGFVKSWAAGLLEKFKVGAPEFRWSEALKALKDITKEDKDFFASHKQKVEAEWRRQYRSRVRTKEPGKPVVSPEIADIIAQLRGTAKSPDQTPKPPGKLFGTAMKVGEDFAPENEVQFNNEQVFLRRNQLRVGDVRYEILYGDAGAQKKATLVWRAEGQELSKLKVKVLVEGNVQQEVPFVDVLGLARDTTKSEHTLGKITLKKLEQKNG